VTVRGSTRERDISTLQYSSGRNAALPSHREGEAAAPIGSNLSQVNMIPHRGGRSLQSLSIRQ